MLKHRVNGRCRYHNRWVRQRLSCIKWSPATCHNFLQRTLFRHSTRIKKNNPTYLRWFSFVEPRIKRKRNRSVRGVTSGWLIEPVTCGLISKILGYKPLIDHANGLVVGTHLEDQFVFRQLPQVMFNRRRLWCEGIPISTSGRTSRWDVDLRSGVFVVEQNPVAQYYADQLFYMVRKSLLQCSN